MGVFGFQDLGVGGREECRVLRTQGPMLAAGSFPCTLSRDPEASEPQTCKFPTPQAMILGFVWKFSGPLLVRMTSSVCGVASPRASWGLFRFCLFLNSKKCQLGKNHTLWQLQQAQTTSLSPDEKAVLGLTAEARIGKISCATRCGRF